MALLPTAECSAGTGVACPGAERSAGLPGSTAAAEGGPPSSAAAPRAAPSADSAVSPASAASPVSRAGARAGDCQRQSADTRKSFVHLNGFTQELNVQRPIGHRLINQPRLSW